MRGSGLIFRFNVVLRLLDTTRTAASSIATSNAGPFDFSAGDTVLDVKVDGGATQNIDILEAYFADSSAGTAAEVAAQIDAALSGGESYPDAESRVVIGSDTEGDGSIVEVTGGTANAVLGFPVVEVAGGGYNDLAGGYVPIDDGSQSGQSPRREGEEVTLPCQLRRPRDWGSQFAGPGGSEERADVMIGLYRPDLEEIGLIDANGRPAIQLGDRVVRIENLDDDTEEAFPNPPGMWVYEVERGGFGLSFTGTSRFNLVTLHCRKDRMVGP